MTMMWRRWRSLGTVADESDTGVAKNALEDRFQHLLDGSKPFSMAGFKEALLTKVLCVVQPERFLSILKYTTDAGGKRELAAWSTVWNSRLLSQST
jgi:hypothetical protein